MYFAGLVLNIIQMFHCVPEGHPSGTSKLSWFEVEFITLLLISDEHLPVTKTEKKVSLREQSIPSLTMLFTS